MEDWRNLWSHMAPGRFAEPSWKRLMSNQGLIYDLSVQTAFKTRWLTNEFIREINAYYLLFQAVPVCAHLIVILGTRWNLLRFTWALGMLPKPKAPHSVKQGVERSHPLTSLASVPCGPSPGLLPPRRWEHAPCPSLASRTKRCACCKTPSPSQMATPLMDNQQISFHCHSSSALLAPSNTHEQVDHTVILTETDSSRQKLWGRANYLIHPRRVPESCLQLSRSCFSFNSKSQENSQRLCKERLNLCDGVKTICI